MKHFQNRKYQLVFLVAILAIVMVNAVLESRDRNPKQISSRPTLDSLTTLLREADADLKNRRFTDALSKYRQALKIDPSSTAAKDGIVKIMDEESEKTLVETPNQQAAAEIAQAILADDPDSEAAGQIVDEADKDASVEDEPQEWIPADLNDPKATPANILPDELQGYKITQNGWLKKPIHAGATYVPRSPAVAKEIDRILVTVSKHEKPDQANRQYDIESESFSVDPQNVSINSHAATFSLYDEARPELFPILTSLRWTRGNWFFSIQIAPLMDHKTRTQPSSDFKRGIAMDVAEKLGY